MVPTYQQLQHALPVGVLRAEVGLVQDQAVPDGSAAGQALVQGLSGAAVPRHCTTTSRQSTPIRPPQAGRHSEGQPQQQPQEGRGGVLMRVAVLPPPTVVAVAVGVVAAVVGHEPPHVVVHPLGRHVQR